MKGVCIFFHGSGSCFSPHEKHVLYWFATNYGKAIVNATSRRNCSFIAVRYSKSVYAVVIIVYEVWVKNAWNID